MRIVGQRNYQLSWIRPLLEDSSVTLEAQRFQTELQQIDAFPTDQVCDPYVSKGGAARIPSSPPMSAD